MKDFNARGGNNADTDWADGQRAYGGCTRCGLRGIQPGTSADPKPKPTRAARSAPAGKEAHQNQGRAQGQHSTQKGQEVISTEDILSMIEKRRENAASRLMHAATKKGGKRSAAMWAGANAALVGLKEQIHAAQAADFEEGKTE